MPPSGNTRRQLDSPLRRLCQDPLSSYVYEHRTDVILTIILMLLKRRMCISLVLHEKTDLLFERKGAGGERYLGETTI